MRVSHMHVTCHDYTRGGGTGVWRLQTRRIAVYLATGFVFWHVVTSLRGGKPSYSTSAGLKVYLYPAHFEKERQLSFFYDALWRAL